MSIVNQIKQDQLTARKNRDDFTAKFLTVLMSDIINVGKNDGNRETTDDEAIQTLKSYLKVNDKNYDIFMKSNNEQLMFDCSKERSLIEQYLPKMATDEAVILALRSFKADLDKDGKPYNVGAAMGFLKKTFGSTLNGATASKLAKDFT